MAAVPSPWDPAQKQMDATYSVVRNRLAKFSNLQNIYIQLAMRLNSKPKYQ
jgi:hypothetical protein